MISELIWALALIVYISLSIGGLIYLYLRSNYVYLKVRDPKRMALQIFAGLMVIFMICIKEIDRSSIPCVIYIIVTNLFTPLYFLPLFVLATALEHTHNIKNITDSSNSINNNNSEYNNNEYFHLNESEHPYDNTITIDDVYNYKKNMEKKKNFMLLICAIIMSVHIIIAGIQCLFAIHTGSGLLNGCDWQTEYEYILLAIISILYAIAFFYIIIWLKGIIDDFGVANELRFAFVWCLICMTIFFVMNLVPSLRSLNSVWPFSTIVVLMLFVLLIITILKPIYNAKNAYYENLIYTNINNQTKEYNKLVDYLENSDALSFLQTFHLTSNKENHKHLENFLTLFNYIERPTCRSLNISANLYNYLTDKSLEDTFKYIPDNVYSKIATVINHKVAPKGELFLPFIKPLRDFVEQNCVSKFYHSPMYNNMKKIIEKDSIIAGNYRVNLNDSNDHHLNLLNFPLNNKNKNIDNDDNDSYDEK